MKDFYYILGTDINCTSNDIREAYRKLSKKFHPDLNQNDQYFESRFRDIREAYETLTDPVKRSEYDVAFKKSKPYPSATTQKARRIPLKTRHIDIAFTISLVIITLIFGSYVYRSLHHSKTAIAGTIAIVKTHSIRSSHHKKKHKLIAAKRAITTGDEPKKAALSAPPTKIIADSNKIRLLGAAPLLKTAPVIIKPAPVINTVTIVKSAPAIMTPSPAVKTVAVVKPAPTVAKPAQVVKAVVMVNPALISNDDTKNNNNNADLNDNSSYATTIKANATGVVYLRKFDNYSSDVVTTIPSNSKVLVLEKGKTFCKVMFNNQTGYVPGWTVQAR